jgi:hypothetical protein
LRGGAAAEFDEQHGVLVDAQQRVGRETIIAIIVMRVVVEGGT